MTKYWKKNSTFDQFILTVKNYLMDLIKKLGFVFVILMSLSSYSQEHLIGIKGGFNLSNINTQGFLDGSDNYMGFIGGLTYEFQMKNRLSLGADLLYDRRGFKTDIVFTNDLGVATGETMTISYLFNYVSLPIKVGYKMGDKLKALVNVGLVPAYLLKAQNHFPASIYSEETTMELTDGVTDFDLAALIEIGGEYTLKEKFVVFTNLGFKYSLTDHTNSEYFDGEGMYHYALSWFAGVKYKI